MQAIEAFLDAQPEDSGLDEHLADDESKMPDVAGFMKAGP